MAINNRSGERIFLCVGKVHECEDKGSLLNKLKPLLLLGLTLMAAACGWSHGLQPDSAELVAIAVKHPIQRHQQVSLAEARVWGLDAYSLDTGDGEYGLYLLLNQQLRDAIGNGSARLAVSFWQGQQLLLAMPSLDPADNGPFLIQEGYYLKVLLDPQDGYMGLQPGTGYYLLLDPREHVRAL